MQQDTATIHKKSNTLIQYALKSIHIDFCAANKSIDVKVLKFGDIFTSQKEKVSVRSHVWKCVFM
jgi:hypothetical protein